MNLKKIFSNFKLTIIAVVSISLILEIFVFNYKFFFSCFDEPFETDYKISSTLTKNKDGSYSLPSKDQLHELELKRLESQHNKDSTSYTDPKKKPNFSQDEYHSYIEFTDINQHVNYIYIDIDYLTGPPLTSDEAHLTLAATDEGNALYYKLGNVKSIASVESSKYHQINTYGNLKSLKICFNQGEETETQVKINKIVFNANVPFNFNIGRVFIIIALLVILWLFRPSSKLYAHKFENTKTQRRIVWLVIAINIVIFHYLVNVNLAYQTPGMIQYNQYDLLAESLAKGQVTLNLGSYDKLDSMDNPYDTYLRYQEAPGAYWDIAYYEGQYYVYFGIVPVLLLYLPYYLITGVGFLTWQGVFLSAVLLLIVTFILIRKIIEYWFPDTSFGMYLLLSIIVANSSGAIPFLLCPYIYNLPILMAQLFTFAGLALWINSAIIWKMISHADAGSDPECKSLSRRLCINLFFGALCMALVAGCRPQFLLGSFLVFPILGGFVFKKGQKILTKDNLIRATVFIIPYILVAAGLMYYNFIRFGSAFDFGANYNLTTNDMTLRGFNFARIPDGLFMYWFQPPNCSLHFPFFEPVEENFSYLGRTVRDKMHGGIMFTMPLLLINCMVWRMRKRLKESKLLGIVVMCISFALIITICQIEMAGILPRYNSDYSWLLLLSATIIILQMCKTYKNTGMYRYIIYFTLITATIQLAASWFIGIDMSWIEDTMPHTFHQIRSWFQ